MFLSLVALILAAASIVLFSEEFAGLIKKMSKIPGVMLIIPFFIASWLLIKFEPWVFSLLVSFNHFIEWCVGMLAYIFPFDTGALLLSRIIVLSMLSMAPVLLVDWLSRKRTHRPYERRYLLSTVIFICVAMIMIVL